MKIISFIERHQGEVIRLRQGFGGTGRRDSPTLRLVGGNARKGASTRPRANGGMKQLEGGRGARVGFRQTRRTA